MSSLLRALLMLAATFALGCGPAVLPPSAPSKLLGKPLPRFKMRTVQGAKFSTKKPVGKVVVVKFFAKYCKPCKKTLPAAQQLHASHGDVAVLGVSLDEYRTDVDALIRSYGLTFPIIHDRAFRLKGRFRISELPATFVADASGKIRWVGGPAQSTADLANAVAWTRQNGN